MANILLATDADWVRDDIVAALEGSHDLFGVRAGRDVIGAIEASQPDLVILDLQIGAMGGMATCMAIRNDQSVGKIGPLPVLMLLDRTADVFLARRCESDGWLVKPLEARRVRRAVAAMLAGERFEEVTAGSGIDPLADLVAAASAPADDPAGAETTAAS